jgi:esterase FrsA
VAAPGAYRASLTVSDGTGQSIRCPCLHLQVKTLEEVLKIAPNLSLKTQGLLDQPSAPLLCINGKDDDQHPAEDIYLLLEHGSPKEVRIFPGAGHMGRNPGQSNHEVQEIVVCWLKQKLS